MQTSSDYVKAHKAHFFCSHQYGYSSKTSVDLDSTNITIAKTPDAQEENIHPGYIYMLRIMILHNIMQCMYIQGKCVHFQVCEEQWIGKGVFLGPNSEGNFINMMKLSLNLDRSEMLCS